MSAIRFAEGQNGQKASLLKRHKNVSTSCLRTLKAMKKKYQKKPSAKKQKSAWKRPGENIGIYERKNKRRYLENTTRKSRNLVEVS